MLGALIIASITAAATASSSSANGNAQWEALSIPPATTCSQAALSADLSTVMLGCAGPASAAQSIAHLYEMQKSSGSTVRTFDFGDYSAANNVTQVLTMLPQASSDLVLVAGTTTGVFGTAVRPAAGLTSSNYFLRLLSGSTGTESWTAVSSLNTSTADSVVSLTVDPFQPLVYALIMVGQPSSSPVFDVAIHDLNAGVQVSRFRIDPAAAGSGVNFAIFNSIAVSQNAIFIAGGNTLIQGALMVYSKMQPYTFVNQFSQSGSMAVAVRAAFYPDNNWLVLAGETSASASRDIGLCILDVSNPSSIGVLHQFQLGINGANPHLVDMSLDSNARTVWVVGQFSGSTGGLTSYGGIDVFYASTDLTSNAGFQNRFSTGTSGDDLAVSISADRFTSGAVILVNGGGAYHLAVYPPSSVSSASDNSSNVLLILGIVLGSLVLCCVLCIAACGCCAGGLDGASKQAMRAAPKAGGIQGASLSTLIPLQPNTRPPADYVLIQPPARPPGDEQPPGYTVV